MSLPFMLFSEIQLLSSISISVSVYFQLTRYSTSFLEDLPFVQNLPLHIRKVL